MAQLFATGIYTTLWTLPRRAENDSQTRDPHETKSHERTEFLVARTQSKHPDRGCAKASHDDRISGRGDFNRASPKKNVRKNLDVILPKEGRDGATWNMQHLAHGGNLFVARGGLLAGFL